MTPDTCCFPRVEAQNQIACRAARGQPKSASLGAHSHGSTHETGDVLERLLHPARARGSNLLTELLNPHRVGTREQPARGRDRGDHNTHRLLGPLPDRRRSNFSPAIVKMNRRSIVCAQR